VAASAAVQVAGSVVKRLPGRRDREGAERDKDEEDAGASLGRRRGVDDEGARIIQGEGQLRRHATVHAAGHEQLEMGDVASLLGLRAHEDRSRSYQRILACWVQYGRHRGRRDRGGTIVIGISLHRDYAVYLLLAGNLGGEKAYTREVMVGGRHTVGGGCSLTRE
jgi:hypothetical protein